MGSLMNPNAAARLERSCGPGDWLRIAPSSPGIERIEARFARHGYDPHRHDTYAIGMTQEGVQAFRYRGVERHSLPGQVYVLHPDETHDGRSGTTSGFRYRGLYIAPGLIRAALGENRALPFLREPVTHDPRLVAATLSVLDNLDRALEELQRDQIVLEFAEALEAAGPSPAPREFTKHWRAVGIAREMLEANIGSGVASTELEAATGLTRYALARHFRACHGTSPYRYLVLRRLDRARDLIHGGTTLAEAAFASGFADQSHLTRHFKKTYGVSPGQWAAMVCPA